VKLFVSSPEHPKPQAPCCCFFFRTHPKPPLLTDPPLQRGKSSLPIGRERGEDDTAFEKQTALFAMAAADVLLVNMWCNDIGREVASGKPLLKTIFQVNLKVFNPRKTTLLFVIRDKSRTPLEKLQSNLREDLDRIWGTITKPERHANAAFTDFFDLRFVALAHYEHAHEQFLTEAAELCERFVKDPSEEDSLRPPGGPAGAHQRPGGVYARGVEGRQG
jgi:hypothetical protein